MTSATILMSAVLSGLGSVEQGDKVSRVSIELTAKGDVTISLEKVADEEFDPADGEIVKILGVPGATVKNDAGFFVIDHAFKSTGDAKKLGSGLTVDKGVLVADTTPYKDDAGHTFLQLSHPRRFGLPLTVEMDVMKHGNAVLPAPDFWSRSMNIHFASEPSRDADFLLVISIFPTDVTYTKGQIFVKFRQVKGGDFPEIGKVEIKDGRANLALKLPAPVKAHRISWFEGIRGDIAMIKRIQCAGTLEPFVGLELAGKSGKVSVKQVQVGSSAAEAGVKVGDRIVKIGNETIRDASTANEKIAECPILGTLSLVVNRNGKTIPIQIQVR